MNNDGIIGLRAPQASPQTRLLMYSFMTRNRVWFKDEDAVSRLKGGTLHSSTFPGMQIQRPFFHMEATSYI